MVEMSWRDNDEPLSVPNDAEGVHPGQGSSLERSQRLLLTVVTRQAEDLQ